MSINDLPGMVFSDAVNTEETELQANIAIPKYYEQYEKAFGLPIIRPIRVTDVTEQNGHLSSEQMEFSSVLAD